jgi:hypothetical protein
MARLRPVLASLLVLLSCATQGGGTTDVSNVPSAGDGPFRPLEDGELSTASVVPYVFVSQTALYRAPSVVGVSTDPSSAEVWMYAVATESGVDVIVRTHADDARSFYGDVGDNASTSHPAHVPPVVLKADQAWEGTSIADPSALLSNGQVLLYYAAAGGIGLATSADGLTFTKTGAPVLAPDPTDPAAAWETSTPHAPSVAVFPDGSWHMLYGAGGAIGEATSADGQTWTRADGNPVLQPSATVDPSTLPAGALPPFDEGHVDDPVMAPQTTLDGRLQVRVLYTGYGAAVSGAAPSSAIGLAGRYGDSGPLSRQAVPTFTVSLHEAAPAFFEYAGGSLLYVQEDDTSVDPDKPFTSIGAAYAPISGMLPAPLPYATTP